MKRLSRRHFLRSQCGNVVALPFLSAMLKPGQSALASEQIPTKLVLIYLPNGISQDQGSFWPTQNPDGTFTLGRSGAPLESFKDQLIYMRNLEYLNFDLGQNGHDFATGNLFTAKGISGQNKGAHAILSDARANNPSFDQFLAQKLNTSSIVLGSGSYGFPTAPGFSHAFWDTNLKPITPINDPSATLNQFFGGANDRQKQSLKLSLVDSILVEYKSLRGKLGHEDRLKLDAHIAHLDQIEKNLNKTVDQICVDAASKLQPASNASHTLPDLVNIAKSQLEILATAMNCGMTQIASLQISIGSSGAHWPGHPKTHHDMSHDNSMGAYLEGIDTQYQGVLASFLHNLKAQKTPDGSDLLHHSVVVMASEYNNAFVHQFTQEGRNNLPFIVAGSGSGKLKTGRYYDGLKSHFHGDLYDTLLPVFGIHNTQFADPNYSQGLIHEILA